MDPRVLQVLSEWEPTVSADESADPIWQLKSYRVARCLVDLASRDARVLASRIDAQTAGQLTRAVASIGANLSGGYSRRSAADRSRFYGYALGSAREAALWYRSVASVMDLRRLEICMAFLAQERMLLVGMVRSVQRSGGLSFERG